MRDGGGVEEEAPSADEGQRWELKGETDDDARRSDAFPLGGLDRVAAAVAAAAAILPFDVLLPVLLSAPLRLLNLIIVSRARLSVRAATT